MQALVFISNNLNTKFEGHSVTHSKDLTGTPKFNNGSRDHKHACFKVVCHTQARSWQPT